MDYIKDNINIWRKQRGKKNRQPTIASEFTVKSIIEEY